MDQSISTATSETGATGTSITGAEATGLENGQPNGEAGSGQSATGSESFIPQGVDLKSLPPALRAHIEKMNSDMVRGFTEKTTKLAQTIKTETEKAVEAYRQKAEFYDQFVNHPDLVKQYNDYVARLQQQATAQQEKTGAVDEKVIQEIQQIKTELQTAKVLEHVNAFADAKDGKGALLHPDFEKLSNFKIGTHSKAGDYDLLRASVELAPGKTPQEKLENGYKAAKATYDAIFEEGRKAGMGRIQQKLKNGSLPPSTSTAASIAPRRPKNAMEALEFARQGLEVARD